MWGGLGFLFWLVIGYMITGLCNIVRLNCRGVRDVYVAWLWVFRLVFVYLLVIEALAGF